MRARNLTLELEASGPFDPAAMPLAVAKQLAHGFYVGQHGYKSTPKLLGANDSNVKMQKSEAPTYGLSLAPADMAGDLNTCTWSTPLCRAACVLVTAGKGTLPSVRAARVVKTRFLAEHPQAFITLLAAELRAAVARHGRIVARLNVASDLRWERFAPELFNVQGVAFYDYTKAPVAQRETPNGYRLTYSVSEREHSTTNAVAALEQLANAAVVFATRKGHALPETWHGFRVIDGDVTDDRTQDPRGTVVGLRAKGSARGTEGSDDAFVKPARAS
jgi:hypothetical protein